MGEVIAAAGVSSLIMALLSLGFVLIGFVLLLVLGVFVFWLWMLIDAIIRDDISGSERVAWIMVIVFVNWLGALIYLFAVKLARRRKRGR